MRRWRIEGIREFETYLGYTQEHGALLLVLIGSDTVVAKGGRPFELGKAVAKLQTSFRP